MKKMTNDVYLMKRLLSKKEQEDLAWEFYSDHGLRFIYPTFKAFVEARIGGQYMIDTKTHK